MIILCQRSALVLDRGRVDGGPGIDLPRIAGRKHQVGTFRTLAGSLQHPEPVHRAPLVFQTARARSTLTVVVYHRVDHVGIEFYLLVEFISCALPQWNDVAGHRRCVVNPHSSLLVRVSTGHLTRDMRINGVVHLLRIIFVVCKPLQRHVVDKLKSDSVAVEPALALYLGHGAHRWNPPKGTLLRTIFYHL